MVLYAAGVFGHGAKVAPGRAPEPLALPAPARTAEARREPVPLEEDAVGTVRSRTVVEVAAQVIGRVLEVKRVAGQAVDVKDPLVLLDDREYAARLAQAKKAVDASDAARRQAEQAKIQGEARLRQATLANERAQKLLATKVISTEQGEAAETEFLQARAALAQSEAAIAAAEAQGGEASQVVAGAEVAFGHTKIVSPITGVVSERRVEPGDLAFPGRTLLIVLDPKALRLEALVRERLISRITLGQDLEVSVPASGTKVRGKVAEIVPSADPLSRTFTVRVDFGAAEGVYAGMFGRLRIPLGKRESGPRPRRRRDPRRSARDRPV